MSKAHWLDWRSNAESDQQNQTNNYDILENCVKGITLKGEYEFVIFVMHKGDVSLRPPPEVGEAHFH